MFNNITKRDMDYITLGKRLKTVRELYRMSQTEVAEQLGVTQTYITRLENGKGSNGEFLTAVLSFYGKYISLDRLFDERQSIMQAMQQELSEPSSDLVRKRAGQLKESINGMFEKYRQETAASITEIQNRFNARMELLEGREKQN